MFTGLATYSTKNWIYESRSDLCVHPEIHGKCKGLSLSDNNRNAIVFTFP